MWQILDAFDDVWNSPSPRNKIKLFESDTRSKGAPYTTVIKWAKPLERARLSTAASKEYRQSLLRIDKVPDSRRKGRFPEMEREVFRRFKEKRARGRKVSARWVSLAKRAERQTAEAEKRRLSRDKAIAEDQGEQRKGSARRGAYTARMKLQVPLTPHPAPLHPPHPYSHLPPKLHVADSRCL